MIKYLKLFLYLLIIFVYIYSTAFAETLNITSTSNITATDNLIIDSNLSSPNNTAITPTSDVSTQPSENISEFEITKLELIKYSNGLQQVSAITANEELKVSQNIRVRFTLNNNFNESNIPFVYLNNNLISNDKSIFEVTTSNVFEIVLNDFLIKQKSNIIRFEKITGINEFLFSYDSIPPSLNIINPLPDEITVSKPDILIEGATDFESKVFISNLPIDVDTFGNFRKTYKLNTGKNIFTIESIDQCGNKTSVLKIINYEPQYPILTFISPTPNSWIKPNEPFLFELSVEDEQKDILDDAQPFITVDNNNINNIDLINYDPVLKKINGIYTPYNIESNSLLNFTVSIADKMGHIGKTNIILNIDNTAPKLSYLSFDSKTKAVEKYSRQNQRMFYNESLIHNFYVYIEDGDSGIDIENSSFYLKNERDEEITLNITIKDNDENNTSSLLELNSMEDLCYGIYKLYAILRDNAGNISPPSTNYTIIIGKNTLDSIISSAVSQFEITRALNYPNPCSSSGTNISFYSTVSPVDINVSIYSLSGQLIRNIDLGLTASAPDGFISTFWNLTDNWGKTVPNGVYIYRISATDNQITKFLKGKIGVLK